MAKFKTLAEAYEHANAYMFVRRCLSIRDCTKLQALLNSRCFTNAQQIVAFANIYEDVVFHDLIALHQTDDGFDWEYVGYYDYDNDIVNISET
jgi:hypothetical protein